MTTGWLPKEILEHLDHAGYVAVPRECVEALYVTELVSDMVSMQMLHYRQNHDFQIALRRKMAQHMAAMLLDRGFIDVQIEAPGKDGMTEHKATLHVVKPRTLR